MTLLLQTLRHKSAICEDFLWLISQLCLLSTLPSDMSEILLYVTIAHNPLRIRFKARRKVLGFIPSSGENYSLEILSSIWEIGC